MYYASHGLNGKNRIAVFDVPNDFKMDFENDFCGITWVKGDIENVVLDLIKKESEHFGK